MLCVTARAPGPVQGPGRRDQQTLGRMLALVLTAASAAAAVNTKANILPNVCWSRQPGPVLARAGRASCDAGSGLTGTGQGPAKARPCRQVGAYW